MGPRSGGDGRRIYPFDYSRKGKFNPMDNSTIHERLKRARHHLGLKQHELAALIKAGPVTISQWETGAKNPGQRSRQALARACGVRLDWLENGNLPMEEEGAAETASPYQAESGLDLAALTLAIETLEAFLAQHRRKLDPKAKAQAVAQLYATMRLWRPEALTAANVTPLLAGLLAG